MNDQTIVNVAAVVQQLSGTGVALLSHDTAQRLRARQAGGAARNLDGQRRAKFPKSQAQGA